MSAVPTKEARILMAIDAIRSGREKSIRSSAIAYTVPISSIATRINGIIPRNECRPNSTILSKIEEDVVLKYLLDRDD